MSEPRAKPCGSWRSPITADLVARGGVGLDEVRPAGLDTFWLEQRPLEGGRYVIVGADRDGHVADVSPSGINVRSRVHEYGGGAYLVQDGSVFFSNFDDQRLYRQDRDGSLLAITPQPPVPCSVRYADAHPTHGGAVLICVRETHDGLEVTNDLAAVPADGSSPPWTIAQGHDFYSNPRVSPDGRRLAWLSWDHPRMPWDGCDLWVGELTRGGLVTGERRVAGGSDESIFQPEWSPDGVLHFVSDRSGWWNLYRDDGGAIVPLAPMEAEFGEPQWWFGISRYAFLREGRIACDYTTDAVDHLGIISPGDSSVRVLDLPFTWFSSVGAQGDRLTFLGASSTEPECVVSLNVDDGEWTIIRRGIEAPTDPAYISSPRAIAFSSEGGETAHALFYPPANRDFAIPSGERPPLVVMSHGGPTGHAPAMLETEIQYWTSRGLAVVEVNYRGSSGYGRAYRERLKGNWGIADVEDCVHAARFLAAAGEVDPLRLVIRGGSAGGYTTLCALTFADVFAAGASHFGISDLETMASDTHKFESRYLDGLIGPYPEAAAVYRQRSPVHFPDRVSCPVILLQGTEDQVVPPSQAEDMARALRGKGIPHAILMFEGEQHGFRRAENIARALEAELSFYARVLGFEPADDLPPLEIEGL